MATIPILIARGQLVRIEVPLLPRDMPMRQLYARAPHGPKALEQVRSQPADWGGRMAPDEQVYDLFWRFITGQPLRYGVQFHEMLPVGSDVWELKTVDVRIFGWFVLKDHFIVTNAAMARIVKDRNLYSGYVNEAIIYKRRLDLDEPKSVSGAKPDDVISI